MRISTLLLFLTFLAFSTSAFAKLNEDDIKTYLHDSSNLINTAKNTSPEAVSDFLSLHLSDAFRFVDYAKVRLNGKDVAQPTRIFKDAYIENVLSNLTQISEYTPELDVKLIKISDDQLTGSAKYRLKTNALIQNTDPQLQPNKINTDSQCTELFEFNEGTNTLRSTKLTCSSKIIFSSN